MRETAVGIAREVARAYRRRCWWADRDDLAQEAILQMLDAGPRFDASRGVPRHGYLRRVAVHALKRMLWRDSAPVSGRSSEALRGLHRAPLDDAILDEGEEPDETIARTERIGIVRESVLRLAEADPAVAVGLQVMMMDVSPRAYAARAGLTRAEVYECTRRAREAAMLDSALFVAWSES